MSHALLIGAALVVSAAITAGCAPSRVELVAGSSTDVAVEGLVVERSGASIPRANVVAYDEAEFRFFQRKELSDLTAKDVEHWPMIFGDVGGERTWTAADGSFKIERSRGRILIQVVKDGFRPATTFVDGDGVRLRVELAKSP